MRVGVVGAGHVGLPTAAVLAHIGHEVVVMDSDPAKLDAIESGTMPFFEPGMAEMVAAERAKGRLRFTSEAPAVASGAEVVFLCVGTPPKASGEANLLAVERAGEAVARHATGDLVLAEKSTVPAGTGARLQRALRQVGGRGRIEVVSNPEFLQEGKAIEGSLHPHRILVGGDSPDAIATMRRLYEPIVAWGAEWIATDIATAELAKHACNAFLAMKISFVNAVAMLAEKAGADVVRIAQAMGSDPRIGPAFLEAGMGYGGYCFPKDLVAFERLAGRLGYDFALLREIARINDAAVEAVVTKVEEAVWNLDEKRVALLGLAFKPATDDTRLSQALRLAERLQEAGADVIGYDPQANANARRDLPGLRTADDLYEALEGAHCAVICTAWEEFSKIDLDRAREGMAVPVIVDGRNLLDPEVVVSAGFTYIPTGRPAMAPEEAP